MVADALGVTADIVAPYYAQPTEVVLGAIRGGERFSVDDPWVFVDLWSRLGIPYPVSSPPAVRVRFDPGWEAKLPYERSDF